MAQTYDVILSDPLNGLRQSVLTEKFADPKTWLKFSTDFWETVSQQNSNSSVRVLVRNLSEVHDLITFKALQSYLAVPEDDEYSDLALAAILNREFSNFWLQSSMEIVLPVAEPIFWKALRESELLERRLNQLDEMVGEAARFKYIWGHPGSGFGLLPEEKIMRLDPLQVLALGPKLFAAHALELIHKHQFSPRYPEPVKQLVDLANSYATQASGGDLSQGTYTLWLKTHIRSQFFIAFWEACERNVAQRQVVNTFSNIGKPGQNILLASHAINGSFLDRQYNHSLIGANMPSSIRESFDQLCLLVQNAFMLKEGLVSPDKVELKKIGINMEAILGSGVSDEIVSEFVAGLLSKLTGEAGIVQQIPDPMALLDGEQAYKVEVATRLETRGQAIHDLWLEYAVPLITPLDAFVSSFAELSILQATGVAKAMQHNEEINAPPTLETKENVVSLIEEMARRRDALRQSLTSPHEEKSTSANDQSTDNGLDIDNFVASENGVRTENIFKFPGARHTGHTQDGSLDVEEAAQMEKMIKAIALQSSIGKELALTRLDDGRYAFRVETITNDPVRRQREVEKAFYEALTKNQLTLKEISELTSLKRPLNPVEKNGSRSGPAGFGGGHHKLADGDARDYSKMVNQYEEEILRTAQRIADLIAARILEEMAPTNTKHQLFDDDIQKRFDGKKLISLNRKLQQGAAVEETDIKLFRQDQSKNVEITFCPAFVFKVDLSGSMGTYAPGSQTPMTLAINAFVILSEACQRAPSLLPSNLGDQIGANIEVALPCWGIAFGPADPPLIFAPDDTPQVRGSNIAGARFGLSSGTLLAPSLVKSARLLASYIQKNPVDADIQRSITSLNVVALTDGDIFDTDATITALSSLSQSAPQMTFNAAILGTQGHATVTAFNEARKLIPHQIGEVVRLNNAANIPFALMDEIERGLQNTKVEISVEGIRPDELRRAADSVAAAIRLG